MILSIYLYGSEQRDQSPQTRTPALFIRFAHNTHTQKATKVICANCQTIGERLTPAERVSERDECAYRLRATMHVNNCRFSHATRRANQHFVWGGVKGASNANIVNISNASNMDIPFWESATDGDDDECDIVRTSDLCLFYGNHY